MICYKNDQTFEEDILNVQKTKIGSKFRLYIQSEKALKVHFKRF